MNTRLFHKGSPITQQAKFYEYSPYGVRSLADPDTITISIYKKNKAAKVSDQNMEKFEVGKYYYIAQTDSGWESGLYDVEVKVTKGGYSDNTIRENHIEIV